jgi:hypothetical protein
MLVRLHRRGQRRLAWAVVLPLALGGAGYAATSYEFGGTMVPLSGMVKSFYASHHFDGASAAVSLAGHGFWWLTVVARAGVGLVYPRALALGPIGHRLVLMLSGVVIAAVMTWKLVTIAWIGDDRSRTLARGVLFLLIVSACHVLLVAVTIGQFSHVTARYYAWLACTFTLGAALVTVTVAQSLPAAYRGTVANAVLVTWVASLVLFNVRPAPWQVPSESDLMLRRLQVAHWLNANTPPDARVGAWNAGELGYFADRTVVNLDGLVNSLDYLAFLRSGRPLTEYLDEQHIEYLVDYDGRDLTTPYLAEANQAKTFRGRIAWDDLDVLYSLPVPPNPLYVLRVRKRRLSRD